MGREALSLTASQIPVPSSAWPASGFIGVDLDQFLPDCVDLAPVAHQAHGPEQIPLNHERVEARGAVLRFDCKRLLAPS